MKSRISLILDQAGISNREFAESVGISDSYVSKILTGVSTNISKPVAMRISSKYGIPYDWVKEGKGKPPDTIRLREENGGVEVMIEAITGAGQTYEPEGTAPLEHLVMPKKIVKNFTHGFKVEGDSMYPTILNGAYVGFDPQDKRLISGKMYVLNLPNEGLVVKRIQMTPEAILAVSDNPMIRDFHVDRSGLERSLIVGRVRWIIQECD